MGARIVGRTRRIFTNSPTSGMLVISNRMSPRYIELTTPQNSPGSSETSRGPGVMPWMGARDPFAAAHPWYVLVEPSDPTPAARLDEVVETALGTASDRELLPDAVVADGSARIDALWNLRENISEAQNREGRAPSTM
ncbi:hypothetical protein AHOG_05240 [Actinoalloteichus hoggarensis]|uniref:Uncharacterized protein n=2 Tax=Actinoalloteichus hoggarensis TaxID=1470176 RepID=A0A221VZI6_9PSEU|nr:hypothetical protein AHOG_05240 [Actinoalloteichus hoggarensis]